MANVVLWMTVIVIFTDEEDVTTKSSKSSLAHRRPELGRCRGSLAERRCSMLVMDLEWCRRSSALR
jgi:hypothetical protein